jgi:hypothetical protein
MVSLFTNGGFETGDFTGWATYTEHATCTITITEGSKLFGVYGCELYAKGFSSGDTAGTSLIQQNIDLTDESSVPFSFNINSYVFGSGEEGWLHISAVLVQEESPYDIVTVYSLYAYDSGDIPSGTQNINYDCSALTGIYMFEFRIDAVYEGA